MRARVRVRVRVKPFFDVPEIDTQRKSHGIVFLRPAAYWHAGRYVGVMAMDSCWMAVVCKVLAAGLVDVWLSGSSLWR